MENYHKIEMEFDSIIHNIRKMGNNSTDIASPGIHLAFSVDETNHLSKPPQPKVPKKSRKTFFSMGNLQNRRENKKTAKVFKLDNKNKRLRYILVTKDGEVISIHKHPNIRENINVEEELRKVDFIYLRNRFNTLPLQKRKLLSSLSIELKTWDKIEKEIFSGIISTLCETPSRVNTLFDTINKKYCYSCSKITDKKHTCIHFDCRGMCIDCLKNILNEDICPACKRPQIITCPICLEKWSVRSCNIMHCGHGVCYKCINRSWAEMGKGIEQCPQCRQ